MRHTNYSLRKAIVYVLVHIAMLSVGLAICRGDADGDKRLIDGLIKRRLFGLAESFCHDRLNRAPTGHEDAAMTADLIRVLTAKAFAAPRLEQEKVWTEVSTAGKAFAVRHPSCQRIILVQFQTALAGLARAEVETELCGFGVGLRNRQQTMGLLRLAIRDLQKIEEELVYLTQMAGSKRRGNEEQVLTAQQLRVLRSHLRLQLARAFILQSLQFEKGSPDHLHALTRAIKQLNSISPAHLPEESSWQTKILEVRCLRLKGDYDGVILEANHLEQQSPPQAVRAELDAERIHSELDRQRLDHAIGLIGMFRVRNIPPQESFELALLRVSVTAWKQAISAADKKTIHQWRENTTRLVRQGGRLFGRGWSRKADRWLIGVSEELDVEEAVALIQRTAAGLYIRGDIDTAVAMYDQAAAAAADNKELEQAFNLGFKAAAICYQSGKYLAATNRFSILASQYKANPKAVEAQELAVLATAVLVKSDSRKITAYRKLLENLAKHWPAKPQANNAQWWLAKLSESQLDFQAAASHYKKISSDDRRWPSAIENAVGCDRRWLEQVADPEQRRTQALAAIAFYDNLGAQSHGSVRLAASQLRIRILQSQWQRVHADLGSILADPGNVVDQTKQAASAGMVITAAALSRFDEAKARLQSLRLSTSQAWLDLACGLAELRQHQPADIALPQLGLAALDRLAEHCSDLRDAERLQCDHLKPQLLLWSGQTDKALVQLERLLVEYPDDRKIREQYASSLSTSNGGKRLQQALQEWRKIQSTYPSQSVGWFRARYEIASVQAALGATARAIEIIELTKTLYPDLGGSETTAKFNKLWERCRASEVISPAKPQ